MSVRTFLEKGEKPEKRRSQEGELRFCFSKVRVRLTLIKIKYMIVEITINILGISFGEF